MGTGIARAFFDDGTPLGSVVNSECRIDSIAQSWAVISVTGDGQRAARAMAAVDKYLIRRRARGHPTRQRIDGRLCTRPGEPELNRGLRSRPKGRAIALLCGFGVANPFLHPPRHPVMEQIDAAIHDRREAAAVESIARPA